jgi:hypothetical protein
MTKYSVLLLFPEDDNDGGKETCYFHTEAEKVNEATLNAANLAIDINGWDHDDFEHFEWHIGGALRRPHSHTRRAGAAADTAGDRYLEAGPALRAGRVAHRRAHGPQHRDHARSVRDEWDG